MKKRYIKELTESVVHKVISTAVWVVVWLLIYGMVREPMGLPVITWFQVIILTTLLQLSNGTVDAGSNAVVKAVIIEQELDEIYSAGVLRVFATAGRSAIQLSILACMALIYLVVG